MNDEFALRLSGGDFLFLSLSSSSGKGSDNHSCFPVLFQGKTMRMSVLMNSKAIHKCKKSGIGEMPSLPSMGASTAQEQINPLACFAGPLAENGFCSLKGCRKTKIKSKQRQLRDPQDHVAPKA